ncbi:hypothetical protein ADICYQ_0338 [Cyclobacterium qasimii M12-11B]|uniref:Uncharacterized protein n=1 Tax=Cyclobacterium qasimii M12-11B TaxID=641524 RepID=S7VN79_9BACT|nr:hypothetical protein ADICYQ_0338 [Cyclobacterium qasimii M12-11B]
MWQLFFFKEGYYFLKITFLAFSIKLAFYTLPQISPHLLKISPALFMVFLA